MATLEWIWSFVHTYNPSLCPFMVASYTEYAHLVFSVNCTTQCHFKRGAVGSASNSWLVDTCQSWVWAPSKDPVVSLSQKLYSHCLLLVCSRNRLSCSTGWDAVLVELQYWLSYPGTRQCSDKCIILYLKYNM